MLNRTKRKMEKIGKLIESKRKELNLSTKELAEKLGYKSAGQIEKIERGEADIPQSRIGVFAKVLDIPAKELARVPVANKSTDAITAEKNNGGEFKKVTPKAAANLKEQMDAATANMDDKKKAYPEIKPQNKSGFKVMYDSVEDIDITLAELQESKQSMGKKNEGLIRKSLSESKHGPRRTRLTMKIVGVERKTMGGKQIEGAVGFLQGADGKFKIFIPEDKFFPADGREHKLTARLGTIVDFVLDTVAIDKTNTVDKVYYLIGNRLEGMRLQRINVWQRAYSNVNKKYSNGKPLNSLHKYSVVPVNIVEIVSDGIIVELGGIESFIPKSELSYERLSYKDMTERFKVGKSIRARILTITDRFDAKNIMFTASIKSLEKEKLEDMYNEIAVEGYYIGTVERYVVARNEYYVKLDTGFTIMCSDGREEKDLVQKGESVGVVITDKYDDTKKARGRIKYVVR